MKVRKDLRFRPPQRAATAPGRWKVPASLTTCMVGRFLDLCPEPALKAAEAGDNLMSLLARTMAGNDAEKPGATWRS